MNDVKKHAENARMHLKTTSGELWLFLDSNKKVVNGDEVMILSKIRLCGFEQTSKIKSLNQPTLKLNPPVFGGFWPSFIEKKRPQTLANPHATHMSSPRGLSPKMGIPTSCLQSKSNLPSLRWSLFCFRLVRKGQKLLPAVWGEALHKCWSYFYLKKKNFPKMFYHLFDEVCNHRKRLHKVATGSSPGIQKHHRICFISLICI